MLQSSKRAQGGIMRKSTNLRNINLNLLPILGEILHRRNVTEAARHLNLTQSAVSASLKRLRLMFDDDLLIPRGRELILTEKAESLLPGLDRLLANAGDFLEETPFDPTTAKTKFRIATADYVTTLLAPHLSPTLRDLAPNVTVQVTAGTAGTAFTPKNLRQNLLDLIIGPEDISRWMPINFHDEKSDFAFDICSSDELVGIESTKHHTDARNWDLESYLSHPHVTFHFNEDCHASIERETISSLNLKQNDKILVPEFTLLPMLVCSTGFISVVPKSLGIYYAAHLPLRLFTPPLPFPPLRLVMIWSKARQRDEELTWFRKQVKNCFSAIG